jgi:hypothetical protein
LGGRNEHGADGIVALVTVTGVLGGTWRADVSAWGRVAPWDGSPPLDWHVAADDRWHSPAAETAVRQRRLAGAPVFETRLRVPGGDAVHRVWSVARDGGWTVVEVVNDSPLPFACAFTRGDVVTSRPPADVPIEGIDLAAGSIILPVGHRAGVIVGLRHGGAAGGTLPDSFEPADAVARGWVTVAARASRLVLPDRGLVDDVVAARCDLLLAGPPRAEEDAAGFLLAAGELVRLGELDEAGAASLVADVAAAAGQVARRDGWDAEAALRAAALVLQRAGERRAVADVTRIVDHRATASPPAAPVGGIRAVALTERQLARGPELFPHGIPPGWRGAEIEAHGLAVGPATTLSFAVRWHGEHPAVLWELTGDPVELRAPAVDPAWRTSAPSGEALWRARSS